MQSPQKLQARLNDLLGPPGPDSDPLELMLRSVVSMTAPTVEAMIGQYTPEQLDQSLESVAVFFLKIRSDEAALSIEFLEELGRINAHARALAHIEGSEAPPALAPAPADPAPGSAPAAPAPASPDTPGAVPASVPPAPAPEPAGGRKSGELELDTDHQDSSPGSEAPTDTATSEAAPAPPAPAPASQRPPAPPWG